MRKSSISLVCLFACSISCLNAQDFFDFRRFWQNVFPFTAKKEALVADAEEEPKKEIKDDRVITSSVKGILLVGKSSDVIKGGASNISGVQAKDIRIPGGIKRLRKILSPLFINKPLKQSTLLELKRQIIRYYREENRPIVTVEVPEQDVTEGVIQFVVIESRLGDVRVRGCKRFSKDLMRSYLNIESGDPIDSNELLTDIAWINRNPFRRSDLVLTPGKKEATTDIELIVKDRPPIRIFAGADNTGNRATGNNRFFIGGNWGNVLGCDHTLSYQATTSFDPKRFLSQTFHYTAPLFWQHVLMIYGGYASVRPDLSRIDTQVKEFKSRGKSTQVSFRYEIPLGTTYKSHLKELVLGFDFKNTDSNLFFLGHNERPILTNYVNLTQFVGGFNAGIETVNHKFTFTADVFWSPGELLSHQTERDFEELQRGAKNKYVYGQVSLGDIYRLPYNFSFSGLMRGQAANGTLLPSEQFGLGGYSSVRGYDEREVNEDNAFILNLEVRTPPVGVFKFFKKPKVKDELVFLGFVDYGIGVDYHPMPDTAKNTYLLGVGPGLRYTISPYLSARLDLGFKLHHKAQFRDDKDLKVHFGIVASY